MRVLVVGGSGQLGSKIVSSLTEHGFEVHSTYLTNVFQRATEHTYLLDTSDLNAVNAVLDKANPEIVIDAAALTNVDYCETHKEDAFRVNSEGAHNLALASQRKRAKLVFVSTDFVFDGGKGNYDEDSSTNPINYYGETKLKGEEYVRARCERFLILRSSVIFSWTRSPKSGSAGAKPMNFGTWLTSNLMRGEPVRIVDDQYGSPTLADDLADTVAELLHKDAFGLLHVAGRTRASRLEFAVALANQLGLRRDLITPIKTSELRQAAPRPSDTSLNVSRVEGVVGHALHSLPEALDLFARQFATESLL